MAIPIPEVPATQLVGLSMVMLDRQGTSPAVANAKTCIVGQKTSAGSATANTLVQVTSAERATALFGVGSQLAIMCKTYLQNDPLGNLWAGVLADNGTTKATGTIEVTAAATGDGTIALRLYGYRVQIGVTSGDSAAHIGASIRDAANAIVDLPVLATLSTATVTFTAKNAGVAGNTGRLELNPDEGNLTPPGVAMTITQMSGGATDPVLTTLITAMTSSDVRWWVLGLTDVPSMEAIDAEALSRWDAARALRNHAFSCRVDSVSNLTTDWAARNSPHQCTFGILAPPNPSWEIAAAAAGQIIKRNRAHPAVPHTGTKLVNRLGQAMPGPVIASRFSSVENNTLGLAGVATLSTDTYGQLQLGPVVTHYKRDGSGVADTTLRWFNTLSQLMYVIDDIEGATRQYSAGKILVNDASVVEPGTPVLDRALMRAHLAGRYELLVRQAIADDLASFVTDLVVERNVSDPNRLDISYPLDVTNQVNVVAVLLRTYLQRAAV